MNFAGRRPLLKTLLGAQHLHVGLPVYENKMFSVTLRQKLVTRSMLSVFCALQVDVCKRVIHLYRSVVLEVEMEPATW